MRFHTGGRCQNCEDHCDWLGLPAALGNQYWPTTLVPQEVDILHRCIGGKDGEEHVDHVG